MTDLKILTPEEFVSAEMLAEKMLTVQEIYEQGFKDGQSLAGLRSNPEPEYEYWLARRSGLA